MDVSGVRYVYGPDGKRLKKIATDGTQTLYLGADIELKSGVWTKYLHQDAKKEGAATTWMHRDHLKTIRLITDATGQNTERSNYTPTATASPPVRNGRTCRKAKASSAKNTIPKRA